MTEEKDIKRANEDLRKTIRERDEEISRLKHSLEQEKFAQRLSRLLISSTNENIIISPFSRSRLLEMIVQAAMQVISAQSASLFLIDEEMKDLVFEVALGPTAHKVKKFRVPIGHGFAGLVAVTGQPMAIANTQEDYRLAHDIATAVNYTPKNILCVPLFFEDRIIGVLELLDKIGSSSFTGIDIEILGTFANIAAIAIAQSQVYDDQQSIMNELLKTFKGLTIEDQTSLQSQAHEFVAWLKNNNVLNSEAREVALLVRELIFSGEQNCRLCKQILRSLVTHMQEVDQGNRRMLRNAI